jgi:hypothetical protein
MQIGERKNAQQALSCSAIQCILAQEKTHRLQQFVLQRGARPVELTRAQTGVRPRILVLFGLFALLRVESVRAPFCWLQHKIIFLASYFSKTEIAKKLTNNVLKKLIMFPGIISYFCTHTIHVSLG